MKKTTEAEALYWQAHGIGVKDEKENVYDTGDVFKLVDCNFCFWLYVWMDITMNKTTEM